MSNKLSSALVLALGLGAASLAQAGFIGQTVTGEHLFPNQSTIADGPYTAIVGAGVEFSMFGGIYTVDVSDTNLLLTFPTAQTANPATFNGFHLFDTNGTIDAITSVSVANNGWAGFDPTTRVTFDANNIWINMQSVAFDANTSLSLDVGFGTQPPNPNPTPEPATLALLGLGLVGLGALRRKA